MNSSERCLYDNYIKRFIDASEMEILGILCDRYHGEALTTTREAWKGEIAILQKTLAQYRNSDGRIIFEYDIPRLGKRIDVVLLLNGIVFCLEFKVGETRILETDIDQVLDYALDLKNFHKFSQEKVIVPILVATNFTRSTDDIQMSVYDDKIVNPLVTGETDILKLITAVINKFPNELPINQNWIISPYAPTPTIIEAARSLYENHSVENITRHAESKTLLSELEKLHEEIEQNNSDIIKLQKELGDTNIVLDEAKSQFEILKKEILGRKKTSNSYSNVMLYKDAIDQFISENVNSICDSLNQAVTDELRNIHFRNDSIDRVEISPKSFEMKVYEASARLIPSDLFSAGEKQLLLGLVIKEALSLAHNDTFFLFDTPVGRLDSGNRKLFTNQVIFEAASQVFVFATDSDYSSIDYDRIKDRITTEMVLKRNENDQIVMLPGSMY